MNLLDIRVKWTVDVNQVAREDIFRTNDVLLSSAPYLSKRRKGIVS